VLEIDRQTFNNSRQHWRNNPNEWARVDEKCEQIRYGFVSMFGARVSPIRRKPMR
jgi:hypothetical protein